MAIENDFTIDYATKRISHTSGATRYSVNALYSWLQDVFDELGQLDDDVPMAAFTPTEYAFINGWQFGSDADLGYLFGGSIKVDATNDLWANFYSLGSIEAGTVVYIAQDGAVVSAYPGYASGHIDQLVKVRAGGVDADSRYITVFARNVSDSFDHFKIQAPATGGRNPVPLATSDDLNNQTAEATLGAAPYTNIAVTFGAVSKDVGDGAGNQPYAVTVDCAGLRLSQVYEYLKYLTRRGAAGLLNGVQGQFYTAANASYTEVKSAPFGTFAGGKFFGARGVWLENYDAQDGNAFQLIDANNVNRTPPTTISVKVDSVVAGDRIFMARTSGGLINKSQFTIQATTANSITATAAPGADIPAAGALRVGDSRFTYTGRSGATFTGVSPSPAGLTGSFYVPIIDEQAAGGSVSKSLVYAADIPVLTRVRKKGILPFEVAGTVTNTGLTVAAIRTSDTVVT
jgi:hypothetical protein